MEQITILIADDHPMFRFGMRARLGAEPDLAVVGEAGSGEEAVELAAKLAPDVVLMDLNLPGINGIEATRLLRDSSPAVAVLVVTMFDDDSVFAAMRAGARGYLLKDAEAEETVRAIRAVANGEAIFSPSVAKRLMGFFAAPRPAIPAPTFPELTEREREVLELLAQGYTNIAIAQRLFLSPKTARNYVSSIFGKLQVADRTEAIVRARQAGLGRDGS
ncbi:MAG: response regulator transcription factor [Thermomicrobiales bacterium]